MVTIILKEIKKWSLEEMNKPHHVSLTIMRHKKAELDHDQEATRNLLIEIGLMDILKTKTKRLKIWKQF